MKNKNGFTLIELLAVIVILAVVALIAVPIILNVIESAKKGAIKNSAYGLVEAANVYVANSLTDGLKTNLKFTCENNKCISDDKEISFKGKVEHGTLIIDTEERVLVCVDDGEYYALKDLEEKKVISGDGTCGVYEEENGTFVIENITSEKIKALEAELALYKAIVLGNNDGSVTINDDTISWDYEYASRYEKFTAPVAGTYRIELWGASGGNSGVYVNYGAGAYTAGEIELEKDQELYIYIGQTGSVSRSGTWNGGGGGGTHNGYSGGGATDIRTVATSARNIWQENESLRSRIMVAAGGAGYSGYDSCGEWGYGGGLTGYKGSYHCVHGDNHAYGLGGSQLAGGGNGNNIYGGSGASTAAGFGVGSTSNSVSGSPGASGGGGGYYGGGSGGDTASGGAGNGGAGGSSYISGHAGCIAIESKDSLSPRKGSDGTTVCAANTTDIECSKHYSGLVFTNTKMIDGKGYEWTTKVGTTTTTMPSHGTNIEGAIGNVGDGHAKITILNYSLKK